MQGGMNIVLKTGATSLLLRDALRRPLAEVELGEVDASVRRIDGNVTRVINLCLCEVLTCFRKVSFSQMRGCQRGIVCRRHTWEC